MSARPKARPRPSCRMTLYAKAAAEISERIDCKLCSTVGEVADIYAKEVGIPVMKVDLPRQEAVGWNENRPDCHSGNHTWGKPAFN